MSSNRTPILAIMLLSCFSLAGCQISPFSSSTPTSTITPTATQQLTDTPRPNPTAKPIQLSPEAGERFTSPDGTFSFPLPEGWEFISHSDDFFRFSGPGTGSSAPSLVISQMQDQWLFEMWTAMFQDDIAGSIGEVERSSEDFLTTQDGQPYFRWEFTAARDGKTYHQVFYMYGSGDWKLVIAYTRPENTGTENDVAIDAAMQAVVYEH